MDINVIKHDKGTNEKKWYESRCAMLIFAHWLRSYGHLAVTQIDLPTSARMICFPRKERKHVIHDETGIVFLDSSF
jgi:hypothetical protein